MPDSPKFQPVFEKLRDLLQPYKADMLVAANEADGYGLNVPEEYAKGQQFFAGVQVRKNYVSYYLMPVYMYPDLLDGISPGLKKRMQGKSCFNFKSPDDPALPELAELTQAGYERFKAEGLV